MFSSDFDFSSVSENAVVIVRSDDGGIDAETLQNISDKMDLLQTDINNSSFILIFAVGLLLGFFTLKSVFGKG